MIFVLRIFIRRVLELVVHRRAGGLAFGDIRRNLKVLWMILISIYVLPRVELADEAKIIVRLGGVGYIDAYFLRNENIYLTAQSQQTLLNDLGILRLGMPFCFIQQSEENDVLNHIL